MNIQKKMLWLGLFAIAMAFVETAIVIYLRELYFPENILQIFPPRMFHQRDLWVELMREFSTIVMLVSVAVLAAERSAIKIFAAFIYAFGLWDLFYYLFLKITINWPTHWLEWDILFLIPWAWLGPWICPALIALMFVVWGYTVNVQKRGFRFSKANLVVFLVGCTIALVTFLQPAFPLVLQGNPALLESFIPRHFWWAEFILGYLLMAVGLFMPFWPSNQDEKRRII